MRNGMSVGLLALAIVGCGASSGVSAAQRGDRAALSAYIKPLHDKGQIDNAEAARIAKAELVRELSSAKNQDALDRLHDAQPCVPEIESVLEDLADKHDALGAAAALALYETGNLSASRARSWATDAMPEWRAVGVRALVREQDDEARHVALVDPRPEVRRASMRASAQANDPRDLDGLFEAARLDPEPMARNEAVRAIAHIETSDPEIANRLRDLWTNADDAVREDIANAYASPAIAVHGGAEALRVLVASGHGPGVISAAAAILRASMNRTSPYDKETRESALALLLRTIDAGSRRDRSFALAVVPVEDTTAVLAIKKASTDAGDLDVRISALSRLLEVPTSRADAIKDLEALAQPDEDRPAIGPRARAALARAGDLHIQAWIEKDLANQDASIRLGALSSLAALGRPARGAPLLADADVRVRTRAACAIIVASR
jgi:HEAT repeats